MYARHRSLPAFALALVAMCGCSNETEPEPYSTQPATGGIKVAEYISTESGGDAATSGELTNDRGCLALAVSNDEPYVVVLPANYYEVRADDDVVLLEVKGTQVQVGDFVGLGGSGGPKTPQSGVRVPAECDHLELWWYVSDLLPHVEE